MGTADAYGNLGLVYLNRGDLAQAREYGKKAQELFTKVGMRPEIEKVQA